MRVSNELGADNPDRAKHATGVTLKLTVLLALCIVIALLLGHNLWSQLFSSSSEIKQEFASMTPLLATSILLDFVQSALSGLNYSLSQGSSCVLESIFIFCTLFGQGWPEDAVGNT